MPVTRRFARPASAIDRLYVVLRRRTRSTATSHLLRRLLEPYAVTQALPHLRDVDWKSLRKLLEQLDRASGRGLVSAIEKHLAFHRYFYEKSGNATLLALWRDWELKLRLFFIVDHEAFQHAHDVAGVHEELLAVIETGHHDQIRKDLATMCTTRRVPRSAIHCGASIGGPAPARSRRFCVASARRWMVADGPPVADRSARHGGQASCAEAWLPARARAHVRGRYASRGCGIDPYCERGRGFGCAIVDRRVRAVRRQ
jgi:FCD domain